MKKQEQNKVSDEFSNFRQLARKLVAVPKKEVDEKKADYERDKSKKERLVK